MVMVWFRVSGCLYDCVLSFAPAAEPPSSPLLGPGGNVLAACRSGCLALALALSPIHPFRVSKIMIVIRCS